MDILNAIRGFSGSPSLYACTLDGAESLEYDADRPQQAASVIKLAVMAAAFRAIQEDALDAEELFTIRPEQKLPSCGALTYLHDGLRVTLKDLIVLMIIVSDNTAANLLIDRLGIDAVNGSMEAMGIRGFVLRRRLFDAEASARGLENTVTARAAAELFLRLAAGTLVSPDADREMLSILGDQRLNGKLPFFLHSRGVRMAHKTGEDAGITHDCGIVWAARPFLMCALSNAIDVPAYERFMQDAALELYGTWGCPADAR